MAAFLHVGDRICLFEDLYIGGYVATEGSGFTEQDGRLGIRQVGSAKHVREEAVFVVCPQFNYSLAKQTRAFLEREGLTAREAVEDSRYQALLL